MARTSSSLGEIERVAVIGAEVHGADLTPPLSDGLFAPAPELGTAPTPAAPTR